MAGERQSRGMHVAIRVDASAAIGTGHVMRSLTLGRALRALGSSVCFVSREHAGSLCDYVESQGFLVARLVAPRVSRGGVASDDYAAWLGVPQELDADETLAALAPDDRVDWLVVDHYGLDAKWENRVRERARHIMVIDDLANRAHACEVLLDQNLNQRGEERYRPWVPDDCRLLLGPAYALLREEFAAAVRERASRTGRVERALIYFGGIDPTGETLKACRAVAAEAPKDIRVDVIAGATDPHRDEIEEFCAANSRFRYHHRVDNMAELMVRADLALGAGGTTSWERTFLGLPTITLALAENQEEASKALAARGAIRYLGLSRDVTEAQVREAVRDLLSHPLALAEMGRRAIEIYEGDRTPGTQRVIAAMDEVRGA